MTYLYFKKKTVSHIFLPPANVVCEGYIFTGVCDSVNRGGVLCFCWGDAWLLPGECVWLLGGACMVFAGGHVWFLPGGACVVFAGGHAWFLPGGMRGFCQGGMCGFCRGACVVFAGGHAWFFPGGACIGYDEIRSMSRRYASYWNAYLLLSALTRLSVRGT